MEAQVAQLLNQMSAEFYEFHADSFDASRQNPWDSWNRILLEVGERTTARDVLDLGCGNGRFAGFLSDQHRSGTSYTGYIGIDPQELLISAARQRYPGARFLVGDVEAALGLPDRFDLLVCFGVFHHLPGRQYRQYVLNSLPRLVRHEGLVVISLWQPRLLKNFDDKVFPDGLPGMEPNDFLLGWKGDFSHRRYCHNFDENEIDGLISEATLALVAQFQGTGNDLSNRYLLFQKS